MRLFKATADNSDLEKIVTLFRRCLADSPYPVAFNEQYWTQFITIARSNPDVNAIFLAEVNDEYVGTLVGQVYFGHPLMDHWKCAMELFWYVKPEHRGLGAFRMVNLYEQWAREVGCGHCTMSLLANEHAEKLDRIYTVKGYKKLETQYFKELKNEKA
jgi:GNAT superfamily N-acetyltransferase